MTRAGRKDWRVLVNGGVSKLMLLAGEVLHRATVIMGGGGGVLLLRTVALSDPTSQDVALMSISSG